MANVSLLAYLQSAPPPIPADPPPYPSRNTTNTHYGFEDVQIRGVWHAFNVNTVMQRYGPLLAQTFLPADPMPVSPPRTVSAENALKVRVFDHVGSRVRRGLRAGFAQLEQNGDVRGVTRLSFDVGDAAQLIDSFAPDSAYFDLALPTRDRPNRAPGDVKPSWKWNSGLATGVSPFQRQEYLQALSQVNWYMKQHRSRYGFIVTDLELVVFRRVNNEGLLEVASPIPYTAPGNLSAPCLTVLLALWYLGMLAAQDEGEEPWQM